MLNKKNRIIFSVCLIISGFALIYFSTNRSVTIYKDGQSISIKSRALTVGKALADSGIQINQADRILPAANHIIGWKPVIAIKTAKQAQVWTPQSGLSELFYTTEILPGNILKEGGVRLFPGDKIRWNGAVIDPSKPLPDIKSILLQVDTAKHVELVLDDKEFSLYTAAPTVGDALWEQGIMISHSDRLSPSANEQVEENLTITLNRAKPITIIAGDQTLSSLSAAKTVGTALQDAGVALQGLDYSIPGEFDSLPADRNIQVVRVSEDVLLKETLIPVQTEYVQDPQLELDQESFLETGQPGIKISSQRVRYENGNEISRQIEEEWVARQPINSKIGYGTQVVPHTLETADGVIEYYRAVPVYATSYSPCRSGSESCLSGTSLGLPLKKGVIGVTYQWFLTFGGQEVYIPGYGRAVIADVGGGIPGKRWIDLGYSDDDFVNWSQDTTLYFLTPAPADVPWILP
jgi:resuscitation-promoting factor RpfB